MEHHITPTLGVIGGLGPLATAHFMELVIRMTDVQRDQDHLNMIIYSVPTIPDRTAYILDSTKPSPLPEMIRIGQLLAQQKAECVAIPCFTAHYFFDELCSSIDIPVINAIHSTADYLHQAGIRKVGIMATTGTVRSGLFRQALTQRGMETLIPSPEGQAAVMSLIYDDIKQSRPADMDRFHQVRQELQEMGAEVIILGCTELSMIKRDNAIGPGFIDAMEVLAAACVDFCGKPLSPEGRNLIT